MTKPITLVLLPGLDGTSILFQPFIQALPDWIHPRCVEYPSSGRNDYPSLLPVVRDVCAGLEDFVVLGWSFSGPLALMVAAESPRGLGVSCAIGVVTGSIGGVLGQLAHRRIRRIIATA